MTMYEEYKKIEPDFNHDHHHHHEQFIVSYSNTGNIVKLPCVGSTGDSLFPVYRHSNEIVYATRSSHGSTSCMHGVVSWVEFKSYGL